MSVTAPRRSRVLSILVAGAIASSGVGTASAQNPFDPSLFPRLAPAPGPVRLVPAPLRSLGSPPSSGPLHVLDAAFQVGHDNLYGAPPDPSVACGPRGLLTIGNYHIVYAVKGSGEVYYDLARDEFFGATHPNNSTLDPRVIYDPQSARFFVMILEVPRHACNFPVPASSTYRAYLRVSVSTSDHPRHESDWLHYSFDMTRVVDNAGTIRHYAPDYPAFAVDATCLTVSANYFEMPLACRGPFGVGVITLSKAALLAGNATPLITYSSGQGEFTLTPASDLWGGAPGGVTYLVEWPLGSTNTIRLWALSDPLGTRTMTSTILVVPDRGFAHPNMGAPQCAPASGPSVELRSWSGTAQGITQWADGSIWFCGTGTVPDGRMRVHFYRLDPNGFPNAAPVLQEAGVLDAGEGIWNFSPSIAANAAGDLGIVFTQSSATLCPRMMAALRPAGASEFHSPLVVASSPEFYADWDPSLGLMRWGDYAAVSVDPVDQGFWVGHMIGDAGQVWPKDPGVSYGALNRHYVGRMLFEDLATGWPGSGRIVRSGQSPVQGLSATPDAAGGVIALWTDKRELFPSQRLQHLTQSGAIASGWVTNGTYAGPSTNTPHGSVLADGAGGAYTVRVKFGAFVVDRVTANGERAAGWPASQVTIAPGATSFKAVAEGPTAVLVAYAHTGGIRVQKVSGDGTPLWSPLLLTSTVATPEICSDGAGGAYVSWTATAHVFVKHVLATGVADPAWPANGMDLGTSTSSRLLADGTGGGFVVYSAATDLRALRFTSAGVAAPGWLGSREVAVAPGNQIEQVVAADGAGGMLVAWGDTRDAATTAEDIYVTRLDANGDRVSGWTANGTRVSGAPLVQRRPTLAEDGAGGAFLAWIDGRDAPDCVGAGCGEDLYWSHVRADGAIDASVAGEGNVLTTAAGDQGEHVLTGASTGSAIATWLDGTLVPDGDPAWFTRVLAQRLEADLVAPGGVTNLTVVRQGCTVVHVDWTAPGDDGGQGTASAYDLRYSTSPITPQNFSSATALATLPPGPARGVETYTFDFGDCSGELYLALVTRDEAGNASGLSNLPPAVSTACAPPPCVTDAGGRPALRDGLARPEPNPAGHHALLVASLAKDHPGGELRVAVYDVMGRSVRSLHAGPAVAGARSLTWDLRTDGGARVHAGLYFVRMSSPAGVFTRGLVVH